MRRPVNAVLMSLVFWGFVQSAAEGQVSEEAIAAWRADLTVLVTELPKRHKDAFALIDEASWRAESAALDARLGDLTGEAAFDFELMKLVAQLGDSHTSVSSKALFEGGYLPLGVHWFKDGPRVIQVPRAHRDLLGWKLEGIGDASLEEVTQRLSKVVVFDNEASARNLVPRLLTSPKLLHQLGLASEPDRARFTLARGGEVKSVEVGVGEYGAFPARRAPRKTMVTAKQGRKWHWSRYLPKERLLYVQYNRCASNATHDVGKLTEELARRLASGEVKTFVFDVQYNGGGNSILADRLFARLGTLEPFRSRKNVFCVIGRQTFSSAILNATRLKKTYGAQLVGEATGGSPNHFGEVKTFELPRSRRVVRYSTKRFLRGPRGAKTIVPDHLAEMTYADFVAGRDPVMDKIRSLVR